MVGGRTTNDDRWRSGPAVRTQLDDAPRARVLGVGVRVPGEHFISTLTIIPAQTSKPRRGSGSPVRAARIAAKVVLDEDPTPPTSASWCTTNAPSAVRRTSSSTPSAPCSRASSNAASVFSAPGARCSPVAEHERAGGHRGQARSLGTRRGAHGTARSRPLDRVSSLVALVVARGTTAFAPIAGGRRMQGTFVNGRMSMSGAQPPSMRPRGEMKWR